MPITGGGLHHALGRHQRRKEHPKNGKQGDHKGHSQQGVPSHKGDPLVEFADSHIRTVFFRPLVGGCKAADAHCRQKQIEPAQIADVSDTSCVDYGFGTGVRQFQLDVRAVIIGELQALIFRLPEGNPVSIHQRSGDLDKFLSGIPFRGDLHNGSILQCKGLRIRPGIFPQIGGSVQLPAVLPGHAHYQLCSAQRQLIAAYDLQQPVQGEHKHQHKHDFDCHTDIPADRALSVSRDIRFSVGTHILCLLY